MSVIPASMPSHDSGFPELCKIINNMRFDTPINQFYYLLLSVEIEFCDPVVKMARSNHRSIQESSNLFLHLNRFCELISRKDSFTGQRGIGQR